MNDPYRGAWNWMLVCLLVTSLSMLGILHLDISYSVMMTLFFGQQFGIMGILVCACWLVVIWSRRRKSRT